METLDLRKPSFRANPSPELARVREAGPLCRIEPFGFLGVTRFGDVLQVLKNPKLYSSAGLDAYFPAIPGAELFSVGRTLIGMDPPDHARVRRLIQRAFTIQEMAAWEPRIEKLTRGLIDKVLAGGPAFDLIADLATPLPVRVIAAMLGVDPGREQDFKRWSDDMVSVRSVQIAADSEWRQQREREIVQSCTEFTAYFEQVIAARRRDPQDDLISAIVRAADEGQIITPAEILSLTRLMLVAGNETTTNLLGNAMMALLRRPEQWRALTQDPGLAAGAVEEALRFDGPVLMLTRRVTQDTEIGGERVAEGTVVMPMLASANRDPRQFADPDRFDIRRDASGHIAFGLGVHLCVGAPLARIETRIALAHLAARCPDLALADAPPVWLDSLILRGLKALPLTRAVHASKPVATGRPEAPAVPL